MGFEQRDADALAESLELPGTQIDDGKFLDVGAGLLLVGLGGGPCGNPEYSCDE